MTTINEKYNKICIHLHNSEGIKIYDQGPILLFDIQGSFLGEKYILPIEIPVISPKNWKYKEINNNETILGYKNKDIIQFLTKLQNEFKNNEKEYINIQQWLYDCVLNIYNDIITVNRDVYKKYCYELKMG